MRYLWISVFIFIFDQFTKQVVRFNFEYGESVPVLGDLLRWTYIENPGMAFGIDPGNKIIFSILTFGIVLWLMYYFWSVRKDETRLLVPLAIVIGGAWGNIFDRLFYGMWFQNLGFLHGRVVDFIDVDIPDINFWNIHMNRWPVFNIADSAVFIGVAFLILFHKNETTEINNSGSEPIEVEQETKQD